MAEIPTEGDELKKQYLEKALNANQEAASGAKFSDLFNKDSTIYAKPEETEEEKLKREEEKKKAAPPPKLTTDAEGYPIIEPVRTYKEDLADIVNKDKISLERIAMMQSDANRNAPPPQKPEEKKGRRLLWAGGVLLALGLVIIVGLSIFGGKKSTAPAEPQKERYIIFAESTNDLNIANATKTEIEAAIKKLAGNFKEQDSVKEIVPAVNGPVAVERAALQDLWEKTSARIPDDLLRALYPRFFLGLYSKNGATSPFLLFYTSSYDIAYPALLRWEGFMQDDFNWLFETRPQAGTSTPALFFKDKVVSNLDARSFEDASGKSAFFYLFLDQNTILFARTADTVRMAQDRLRQAKFQ